MNPYICPSCKTEHAALGDGFCTNCGSQLVNVRYCEQCGVQALGTGDFCRECGANLPPITVARAGNGSPADTSWLDDPQPQRSSPANAPRRTTRTATMTDNPTPDWLQGPDQTTYPPARTYTSPTPKPQRQSRPLTTPPVNQPLRDPKAPIPLRPKAPTAGGTPMAVIALLLMLAGMSAVISGTGFGVVLIVLGVIIGGLPLQRLAADGINCIVDWAWADPGMRKRMLDE